MQFACKIIRKTLESGEYQDFSTIYGKIILDSIQYIVGNIEYFDDGSYYEITLQEDLNIFRSSTKNGSKTVTYKSANGTTLWSVTVHGSFSFNGTSAKCTNSTVSTTCPASTWKITSASSSKSGASASATATAKQYISGKLSQTKIKTVTLQCSSSGKLS